MYLTLTDEIHEQSMKVERAREAWKQALPEYEDAAWEIYQGHKKTLNGILMRERVGVETTFEPRLMRSTYPERVMV